MDHYVTYLDYNPETEKNEPQYSGPFTAEEAAQEAAELAQYSEVSRVQVVEAPEGLQGSRLEGFLLYGTV
jgi:hypothetical protein